MGKAIDMDERLGSDDVPEIVGKILDAKTKSMMLGRVLKLESHVVSGIHAQYTDPEKCLVQVIDEFVKQVDPVPTWRYILTALRHPTIRLNRLADQIEGRQANTEMAKSNVNHKTTFTTRLYKSATYLLLIGLIIILSILLYNMDCYQVGLCYSKSLPSVDHFVGREEDIHNITGYLDFTTSDVQVVHIVGPPGFGKSTLAIKIGDILVRKWVRVFYVDVRQRMVRDIDTLSEKILLTMVEERKSRVTFSDLENKLLKQYSETLIILDNCDELFESISKENFTTALRQLMSASPQRRVRYLTTSQQWVALVGNFRLHSINNLSSDAATELLTGLAPSLTNDHKIEIAHLTGNVPLALMVIGAIFRFPDAPSPEQVIKDLKSDPLRATSPSLVDISIKISIHLAYSYLTDDMKLLCNNLSQFPGSFDKNSAEYFFSVNYDSNTLEELVQRSLLQTSHGRTRFFFHQLLRTFFRQQFKQSHDFNVEFQAYYTRILKNIIANYDQSLELHLLDEEKHNIIHMFNLFSTARHVNHTFNAIKISLSAVEKGLLQKRFPPDEIYDISLKMLAALETYTPTERLRISSFFETYVNVILLVARQEWPERNQDAIKTMKSRKEKVDEGYEQAKLNVETFTTFYHQLAQYYRDINNEDMYVFMYTHLQRVINEELGDCFPFFCDYLRISIAFEKMKNTLQSFRFRELAYEHQWLQLNEMNRTLIVLKLYRDYSDKSVGNSTSKMKTFRNMFFPERYKYLLNANSSDYSEYYVYYYAASVLGSWNFKAELVKLQKVMIKHTNTCTETNCTTSLTSGTIEEIKMFVKSHFPDDNLTSTCTFKCATYYAALAKEAYDHKCYILAKWAAEKSCDLFEKLGEPYTVLQYRPASIAGKSCIDGNEEYSTTWPIIQRAINYTSIALKYDKYNVELRTLRYELCYHYVTLNWGICSPLCYFHGLVDNIVIVPFRQYDLSPELRTTFHWLPKEERNPNWQTDLTVVVPIWQTDSTVDKKSLIWTSPGSIVCLNQDYNYLIAAFVYAILLFITIGIICCCLIICTTGNDLVIKKPLPISAVCTCKDVLLFFKNVTYFTLVLLVILFILLCVDYYLLL